MHLRHFDNEVGNPYTLFQINTQPVQFESTNQPQSSYP